MPGLILSGLASGLDTQALVRQLASLEARGLQRIQSRKSAVQSQQGGINQFRSRLSKLSTEVKSLDRLSELARFKTSTTDDEVVTVSASGNAETGSHRISVTQLAQAKSISTRAFADRDQTSFGAGSITLSIGEEVEILTFGSHDDTTLEGIRDKINDSDLAVQASIINDGSGFRLVLSSTKSGEDNAFELTTSNYTFLNEGGVNGATVLSAAQNAEFTIDGLQVTSAENKVTTALEGVTLDLKKVGTNVDVNVERDFEAIAKKLEDFVGAYNDVLAYIDDQRDTSNVTLRSIKSQLQRTFGETLSTSLTIRALSQIGIRSDSTGRAVLDRETLEEAVDGNFEAFTRVFIGSDDDTTTAGIADRFDRILNGDQGDPLITTDDVSGILSSGNGALASYQNVLNSRIRSFDQQIANEERRLDKFEEGLNRRFAAFETLTSRYQSQGAFVQQALLGAR